MKIKTPLTKQRLRTHFTYHLWKYLLAAALTVFCVNLLYTTTAYRSPENLRIEGNIGRALPLNASAHGKLLAAYQDESSIDALIKKYPLQKLCPNTITDVQQLKAEYREIRRTGISISIEESSLGAIGIAAPVFGHDGQVCASLCCGTPAIRLTTEKRELITKNVVEYARTLSTLILNQANANQ